MPDMVAAEILRRTYSGAAYPGYEDVDPPFGELELILRNEKQDWRGALQNAKGVYLITKQSNGGKYVGWPMTSRGFGPFGARTSTQARLARRVFRLGGRERHRMRPPEFQVDVSGATLGAGR